MNKHTFEGKWNKWKGEARKKWGKLTDEDIEEIKGDKDRFIGKIQERYGKSKEEVEAELNNWNTDDH
ncbi:CsbD family protein [Bacillus shivajii]|uniref:CsbD family protein n=1 Tax=Bacillus shivajii TaxID=1983719 RepID=UPI001CF93331|nr:CsbD family protein [Bacillus shivajii]UCZ54169.1 CsbD family protein [Bacillus shivajii]